MLAPEAPPAAALPPPSRRPLHSQHAKLRLFLRGPQMGGDTHHVGRSKPKPPRWPLEALPEGFRGGVSYYRNFDRNWRLLAPFEGVKVVGLGAPRKGKICA